MNVAVKFGEHAPAVEYLDKLTGLIQAEQFKEAADTFAGFEKANPTAYYGIIEALPFRVQNHFASKIGSTKFSIYSLRKTTWQTELVQAFDKGGADFEKFIKQLEAEVAAAGPKK